MNNRMTFDEVMNAVHSSEILLANGASCGILRDKHEEGPHKWAITSDLEKIPASCTLEYEVNPGPEIVPRSLLASQVYTSWLNRNKVDHRRNDEIQPTCPASPTHNGKVRWTRVRQVGVTYNRHGRPVHYEAEVPCMYCDHPECKTYYVDSVGSAAIDAACREARELSEASSKLKSS